jgi:hypothetical protein
MFTPVLESMEKMTRSTMEMQQEMFKKWFLQWPGMPAMPAMPGMPGIPAAWGEKAQQIRTRWADVVAELIRRRRETIEVQFKAGQENIEKLFQLGEARTPEELRAKTIELWQKCLESVRAASEAQLRDSQRAFQQWFELMTSPLPI